MKVLSYNVKWDAMTGKEKRCNTSSNPCINTISNFIENYSQFDLIMLQEASKYRDLVGMTPSMQEMKLIGGKVGPEEIVTLWNPQKYQLDDTYPGSCPNYLLGSITDNKGGGRPIQIIFFRQKICVINIHADHDWQIGRFNFFVKNIIEKYPKSHQNEILAKLSKYDIILGGDFNHKLNDLSTDKKIRIFNTSFYKSHVDLYGITFTNTCCTTNTNFYPHDKVTDHILSTLSGNKTDVIIPYNNNYASDHLPIIRKLKLPPSRNIGFDFDGVLHVDVGYPDRHLQRNPHNLEGPYTPFESIINLIRSEYRSGNKIYIITARPNSIKSLNAITYHLKKYDLIDKISGIEFSNNKSKAKLLEEKMIDTFYDDSCLRIRELFDNKECPTLKYLYLVYPEFGIWKLVDKDCIDQLCGGIQSHIDSIFSIIREIITDNSHREKFITILSDQSIRDKLDKINLIISSEKSAPEDLKNLYIMQMSLLDQIAKFFR